MTANEKRPGLLRDHLFTSRARVLASCLGLLFPLTSGAQAPPYQWVTPGGGTNRDLALSIAADAAGNAYVTGYYQRLATFGPTSIGDTNDDRARVFICKVGRAGNYEWVRTSTAPSTPAYMFSAGRAVALDATGHLYVSGMFRGTMTFGGVSVTSLKHQDSFLLKFNTNGTPVWAVRLGGYDTISNPDFFPAGVAIGPDNNIYVTGDFHGTGVFGNTNLTNTTTGNLDLFLAKYDPNGNLIWARNNGNGPYAQGYSVALDSSGDVLLTGLFWGPVRFGPFLLPGHPQNGADSGSFVMPTPFVAKYNPDGNILWARQESIANERAYGGITGTGNHAVSTDAFGNAYVCGSVLTVIFDNVSRHSDPRLYVSKYDTAGTRLWTRRIGGDGQLVSWEMANAANGIANDSTGDCYVAGYFTRTAQFPGTNLVSRGLRDIFLARFAGANGGLHWVKQAGGVSDDSGNAAATTPAGEMFAAGSFEMAANFDSLNVTGPSNQIFIARLRGESPRITAQPQSQTVIAGTNLTLRVTAGGAAPLAYQWFFHGTNIAGATTSQLDIANVQPSHAGSYSVVVTNAFGAVTSSVVIVTVNFLLHLMVSGSGTVARSPNAFVFAPGTMVTLTALPNSGFGFAGWSGEATGTNNPLAITMDRNKAITAHFGSTTLTVLIEGQGSVAKQPDRTSYSIGERVTLTATAARWFVFQRWEDGPVTNPRSVTIGSNNTYTAIFSPTTAVETITLNGASRTAPTGMPIILVNNKFFADPTNSPFLELGRADVSIATSFANGSIFYTLDGSRPSFDSTLYGGPFRLHHSATLRAIAYDAWFTNSWEADPLQINIEPVYTVYPFVQDGGTVSVTPSKSFYRSNELVTISATPLEGWQFLQWLGDLTGTNPSVTVHVRGDICAQAVFGTTLATSIVGNGSVVVDPVTPFYPYGTVVRLTAIPNAGTYFGAWGNAVSSTNNPVYLTVTEPQRTVSAVFSPLPMGQSALSVLVRGRGTVSPTARANRYATGQLLTLIARPDPGQSFLGWTGDAAGSQTNLTIQMNQSKFITANFTARPQLSLGFCPGNWRDGEFRLELHGDFGVRYSIDASAALDNWQPLITIPNTFGTSQFVDPAPGGVRRFYRATALE